MNRSIHDSMYQRLVECILFVHNLRTKCISSITPEYLITSYTCLLRIITDCKIKPEILVVIISVVA